MHLRGNRRWVPLSFANNNKKKDIAHINFTYLPTYIHILYLNTIWFKAQSLWGRVKMITNG